MSAAIGLLEIEFLIPASFSLKDKRKVVKSIKDKLTQKLNISVAEVEHQDLHARCQLAIVTISSSKRDAEERMRISQEMIESNPEIQVTERLLQWL